VSLQLHRIDVDHDLPILSAVGRRHGGSWNAGDLVSDLELQKVVQLGLVEPLPRNGQQTDRQTGGVDLKHHWREGALRQPPQVRQRQIGNLGDVGIGVGARLKIDFDQADAGHRARLHVIHATR
jgi:hypothetical protein